MITIDYINDIDELQELGGKGFHLRLLQRGGFPIPQTNFAGIDIQTLPDGLYIVRSSASSEDSASKTAAGKYDSMRGVPRDNLQKAIAKVASKYSEGNVVIQPDLTEILKYSGVIYTNLNGEMTISLGKSCQVHQIVEGASAETEVIIRGHDHIIRGQPVPPKLIARLEEIARKTENYFGIPVDIEFGVTTEPILLQTRPLPNPTDEALREHEQRRLEPLQQKQRANGLDELVLGVGNYREILGNTAATELSVSTFNYIFSGDGNLLGAMQLGRNELGYDIAEEIFPWVMMVGGKVYYNFAGDALQFRPEGITREEFLDVINKVYIPMVRADPDFLNYPELQLYVQFPEQAENVGLNPEPFRALAERNRKAMRDISIPTSPPIKKYAKSYEHPQECLQEIQKMIDTIRTGSAQEYVKAARLAFFALEDIRIQLENLERSDPDQFKQLTQLYQKSSPAELRDALAYDESISSFELPETEEYRYLGSFELCLPRGFPPSRHFKKGRDIPNQKIAELVTVTRIVLENREKVKFFLFRDYDYVKQLCETYGALTQFGDEIFYLERPEMGLAITEPTLAQYRIDLRKKLHKKELFNDPLFESDLEKKVVRNYSQDPRLIFGNLSAEGLQVKIGQTGHVVSSVDQTVSIPHDTKAVFVEENVRPGSHLFTVLSDYGIPVIAVPVKQLRQMQGHEVHLELHQGKISITMKT